MIHIDYRLLTLVCCCVSTIAPAAHAEEMNAALHLGPVQMLKLVIPQPLASTRAEYAYVQPLHQGHADRLFVDAKPFAELKPLSGSGNGVPFFQATGQSTRIGYRRLVDGGSALWGVSGGYDSLWQQGSYYQQIGAGLEIKRRNFEVVATASLPLRVQDSSTNGQIPLAALNLQVSLPTGVKGLDFEPRIYTVGSRETGTVIGTQMQFTYATSRSSSATISCNYDALGGVSGSLTLQILFPQFSKQTRHKGIDPGLIGSFTGPIGNNGSRVIRLNDSVPAIGN
jgi:hypothetical protein